MEKGVEIMYLLVGQLCQSCGGASAYSLHENKPSEDDKQKIRDSLGGGWCIHTEQIEIKEIGEIYRWTQ